MSGLAVNIRRLITSSFLDCQLRFQSSIVNSTTHDTVIVVIPSRFTVLPQIPSAPYLLTILPFM